MEEEEGPGEHSTTPAIGGIEPTNVRLNELGTPSLEDQVSSAPQVERHSDPNSSMEEEEVERHSAPI